jgi:phosphoglycolate phosphatase
MNNEERAVAIEHVVFDHDGTLVNTDLKNYELFDGIEDLVQSLQQQGIKSYVWTARNRYSTVEILKSLAIITSFEDISCATDTVPKPSPAGIEEMLPGIDPSTVAVVGDSYADMIGANKFGAIAIGALWNDASEDAKQVLEEFGASHLCFSVKECKEILESLIKK